MNHYEPPIEWADHEDIAIALYEKLGAQNRTQAIMAAVRLGLVKADTP